MSLLENPPGDATASSASTLEALVRLNDLTAQLWRAGTLLEGLELILSATVELMHADFGSVRLTGSEGNVMRLAAHRGFSPEFLERFGEVSLAGDSEWMRAARGALMIPDVEAEPQFLPFVEIARAAGYRAMLSLPLVGHGGNLLGILLTQFARPHRPTDEDFQRLELYARQASAFIERCLADERLRANERAVHESAARHAYLIALSDDLRHLRDPVAIQEAAARRLGIELGVSRAVYAEVINDHEFLIRRDYTDGVQSIRGRFELASFGEEILERVTRGEVIVVADIEQDTMLRPEVKGAYRALEVGAFMTAPLVKDGAQVASLTVSTRAPRAWTAADIDLLEETAERTWAAVERAAADERLLENEARLRLALDASQASSWSWDARTGEASWDGRFATQYGFDASTPRTVRSWVMAVHDEDRPRLSERIAQINSGKSGNALNLELRARRADGSIAWFYAIGSAERNAEGRVETVAGIQVDITSRKRAEAELLVVSERLAAIHDQAPFGIAVTTREDGRLVSVNDEWARITGWAKEEAVGKTTVELGLWTAEDRERAFARLEPGGKRSLEVRMRTHYGASRIVSLNAQALAFDEGQYLLSALRDITAEMTIHMELDAHRRKEEEGTAIVRSVLATSAQGILSVARNGIIRTANEALEAMLGWDPGTLAGQPLTRIVPVEGREAYKRRFSRFWTDAHKRHFWTNLARRPFALSPNMFALRRDGTTVPVEISATYVPTAGGGVAFAFITDITERRMTERTLDTYTKELEYRADQLRRLASALTLAEQHANERLALRLHGHLQQLLASTQSTLSVLAHRAGAAMGDHASLLEFAQQGLEEAVAETRAIARDLFPHQLHRYGLVEGLRWQVRWFQENLGLRVNLRADARADPESRQVRALLFESVRELLFNAVKHAKVDHVDVDLSLNGADEIQVVITDTGVGFDPAFAFGPGDQPRAGLGLFSISEQIGLIGGHLHVEAAPGAGARFTLRVPRASYDPELEERRPMGDAGADRPIVVRRETGRMPLSVLVVDDHALVRHGLRLMFEDHPELRIIGEARNGREAITQARALRPDVIVMDVSMPELDGVEATEKIHAELPQIDIIGLTAQERVDSRHAIERAGAVALFTKGQEGGLLIDRLLSIYRGGDKRIGLPD